MSKLWDVKTVRALRRGERKHTVCFVLVLADTPEQAVERVQEWNKSLSYPTIWIDKPRETGNVHATTYGTCSPADLARWRGEEPPPEKPKAEPKPSTRPLGETQLAVLKSLKEHGGWSPGIWVWNNESGTRRIIEGLVQRCLAEQLEDTDPRAGVRYAISKLGLEVLAKQDA